MSLELFPLVRERVGSSDVHYSPISGARMLDQPWKARLWGPIR